MAKFSGMIGYYTTVKENGIVKQKYVEKKARGNLLRAIKTVEPSDKINDDFSLNNRISIVADPFAYENFDSIRYVILYGVKWKVTSIEIVRPRLIIDVGGVFNG